VPRVLHDEFRYKTCKRPTCFYGQHFTLKHPYRIVHAKEGTKPKSLIDSNQQMSQNENTNSVAVYILDNNIC